MDQVKVRELVAWLNELVKIGEGDKCVVISDDTEGNSYHGMFYAPTHKPSEVKELIDSSNGLYDSIETDYKNIVIIG